MVEILLSNSQTTSGQREGQHLVRAPHYPRRCLCCRRHTHACLGTVRAREGRELWWEEALPRGAAVWCGLCVGGGRMRGGGRELLRGPKVPCMHAHCLTCFPPPPARCTHTQILTSKSSRKFRRGRSVAAAPMLRGPWNAEASCVRREPAGWKKR